MSGKRLTDARDTLESHLRTLSSLLGIRNQVQIDIESSEYASKRVAALERSRAEERFRSVHEFNKAQLDRFGAALRRTRTPDSNVSIDCVNRIVSLEKAKELAESLSRKYRSRENSVAVLSGQPTKPTTALSDPSTVASSRKSLGVTYERQKPKLRPPRPSKPQKQPDSTPPPESHVPEFKFINVPDRFHVLPDDQENLRDFVSRVASNAEDTSCEQISDIRRSIQNIKEIEPATSVTFSERRDPSRAIERRRATLAALKLRYATKN